MRCGVVVFPGSNCDHDVYHVLKHVLGQDAVFLWHEDDHLNGCELVVLPGGFSYGDYLRAGALASLSPIMAAVREHGEKGGLILGICNGFQILLEAGLLPGAMRRNKTLRFECRDVYLRVESCITPFTRAFRIGQIVRMPIAHAEGNYSVSVERAAELEASGQITFRYVSEDGELLDSANVNGSLGAIAGVTNEDGNVLGMMPHPERCAEMLFGNEDGLPVFAGALGLSLREWRSGGVA